MSLESFFGLDAQGSAPGSAESREAFQEMMRESAKAAAAIGAHQAAQKSQEDKLFQLLLRYLKDPAKSDIVFLVIKLLQENVPGAFVLAMLSISDPQMEEELSKEFETISAEDSSLSTFAGEAFIPDSIKKVLNAWGDSISKAGLLMPGKTLQGVLTPDQKLKSLVLDILQFSLEEYFHRHGLEFSEEKIRQVALLSIQMVLIKLREVSQSKSDIEIIETPLENSQEQ